MVPTAPTHIQLRKQYSQVPKPQNNIPGHRFAQQFNNQYKYSNEDIIVPNIWFCNSNTLKRQLTAKQSIFKIYTCIYIYKYTYIYIYTKHNFPLKYNNSADAKTYTSISHITNIYIYPSIWLYTKNSHKGQTTAYQIHNQ